MKIEIDMTPADFSRLWNTHSSFGDNWAKGISEGRFEELEARITVNAGWEHAYWVSDWAAVLLCRAYLAAKQEPSTVAWDTACDEFIVLTNYNWNDDAVRT